MLPLGRCVLQDLLGRILTLLKLNAPGLEMRITSDNAMAGLHACHLGGAGPTNVLAFPARFFNPEDPAPQGHGPEAMEGIGAIALNADAVVREAMLYGQDPADHFTRLLTHALLHLAGFQHGPLMDRLTENAVEECRLEAAGPGAM